MGSLNLANNYFKRKIFGHQLLKLEGVKHEHYKVEVFLRDDDKPSEGFVNLIFDDSFIVRNVKVIDGSNGCLLLCQIVNWVMGLTEILHILLTLTRERR